MKKTMCFLLTLCTLAASTFFCFAKTACEYDSPDLTEPLPVSAAASAATPVVEVPCAVLMEKETGKVLFEHNPHEKRSPASITKIMSLLLVMEAMDRGKLKADSVITASEHACSMGGSQIWLEPNEKMTVDELLRAAVIASANDATVALAEAVAGSEEGFVALMNKKAAELKMNDTHFVNCSGLDADGHESSAHDIAVMSCELLKHDRIKKYTKVWMDELRGGKSQLVNTNKLIRFYSGATGLKTGTTSKAGFCVSGSAQKNEMELCAVVLGAADNNARFGTARKLLDYGFANWKLSEVDVSNKLPKSIAVKGGCDSSVVPIAAGKGKYLLSSLESSNLEVKVKLQDGVEAPLTKGQKLGTAEVYCNKKQIGSIDVVAEKGVVRFTYFKAVELLLAAALTL